MTTEAMVGRAFAVWMQQVDRELQARIGVSALDLPDQPYRDWFDAGLGTDEAAELAAEELGLM